MNKNNQKLIAIYIVRIKEWIEGEDRIFTTQDLQERFMLSDNNIIVVRRWINRWEKSGLISKVRTNNRGHVVWLSHSSRKSKIERAIDELGVSLYVSLLEKGFEDIKKVDCIKTVRGLI